MSLYSLLGVLDISQLLLQHSGLSTSGGSRRNEDPGGGQSYGLRRGMFSHFLVGGFLGRGVTRKIELKPCCLSTDGYCFSSNAPPGSSSLFLPLSPCLHEITSERPLRGGARVHLRQ